MLSDRCPVCLSVCLSVCPVCDVGALWPNGLMDQDETWRAGRPRPWPHCVRWGPSSPSPKGAQPLQLIQNSLARAVDVAPKSCHITPVLCCLHWLKITERIEYKLLSLTCTVLTTTQPPSPPPHLCSTSSQHLLFISGCPCSTSSIILHTYN